jgi:hypothetical protein
VQLHSNMLSKHGKECGLKAVIALKEAHCMKWTTVNLKGHKITPIIWLSSAIFLEIRKVAL